MSLLGIKIRKIRKERKLSLDDLAKLTESSKNYIWQLENKVSCNPTIDKLSLFAKALDVTIDYLINDNANLSNAEKENILFRKFNQLSENDQNRIKQIIDNWSHENNDNVCFECKKPSKQYLVPQIKNDVLDPEYYICIDCFNYRCEITKVNKKRKKQGIT